MPLQADPTARLNCSLPCVTRNVALPSGWATGRTFNVAPTAASARSVEVPIADARIVT